MPSVVSSPKLFDTLAGAARWDASHDVQTANMLRRRLILTAILVALSSGQTLAEMMLVGNSSGFSQFGKTGEILSTIGFAVGLISTVSLLLRPALTLPRLRGFEVALFGIYIVLAAWWRFMDQASIAERAFEGPEHLQTTYWFELNRNNTIWVVLILYYGMFIPGSPRRALVMASIMSLVPLGITGIFGPMYISNARTIVIPLTATTMVLLAVASIAVYGSFKMKRLQTEADVARRELREMGQYRLTQRLGQGGMGDVYLAEHRLLKRPCAIKLIRPELARQPHYVDRFEREVRTMAGLRQANIVEVFDFGQAADGTLYYVMEYLPGLSLEELVKRHGPLEAGRAVHFLGQMCLALAEAHAAGLVHRDIKPSNVLVTREGREWDLAKLADFGLVQTVDADQGQARLTGEHAIIGTPEFMSPEQAMGGAAVGPASDLYNLGAVGHFLLAGRAPFVGKTPMEVLVAHIGVPLAPLADLEVDAPADLEDVLVRCLAKDPGDRFASAEELLAALNQCACAGQWTQDRAQDWWDKHR